MTNILVNEYDLLHLLNNHFQFHKLSIEFLNYQYLSLLSPYLVVYPFVKTDGWYQLSREERQGMMTQHFTIGHKYPGVHINTTYSFGLDDQDHVVSFNVTDLGEFLELVMEMRESSARPYTERDTPIFTCRKGEVMGVLESLG